MKKKRLKSIIIIILALIVVTVGGFFIYAGDYYHAGSRAQTALESSGYVNVTKKSDGSIVFMPQNNIKAGFIFYPGGKVENTAYSPLLKQLAENGILCVLVKVPFNLAVFDINAAEGIKEQYPEVNKWYVGGHSLGGAMAATYISKHTQEYSGLILLAAYSTADIKESGLNVISLYGSKDGVLNMEKYNKNEGNLPINYRKCIIEGGCHGGFADYGKQSGDGDPDISGEEQIMKTADYIIKNM